MMGKLYIVVRGDLSPGLRAAQACHAQRLFVEEHPEVDRDWYENSNTIVILEVRDIDELMDLAFDLDARNIRFSQFDEPDLQNEPTAIAVAPEGKGFLRRLPLAFEPEAA
jgi:peptidyl-tRNA hydrolase